MKWVLTKIFEVLLNYSILKIQSNASFLDQMNGWALINETEKKINNIYLFITYIYSSNWIHVITSI